MHPNFAQLINQMFWLLAEFTALAVPRSVRKYIQYVNGLPNDFHEHNLMGWHY